jgi:hypothetical protein
MIRTILAILATSFVTFNLGGLWNQLIMFDFYSENSPLIARPHENPKIFFIIISYVGMAGVMAILFKRTFAAKPTFQRSMIAGFCFGLSMSLFLYLILYSVWDFKFEFLVIDSFWHTVEQGFGGLVMGFVLFKTKKIDND